MNLKNHQNTSADMWYVIARRVAIGAAICATILSILMIANYIQTKSVEPLNSKAINQLVNLILHTTPDHASLLKPYRDLLKIPPILIWRVLYTHLGDVIYNFELDNLRGFQFGDPQDTEHIYVLLFCNKFMVFRLHFIGATQDEIDYMLTTVEFF